MHVCWERIFCAWNFNKLKGNPDYNSMASWRVGLGLRTMMVLLKILHKNLNKNMYFT
jgi:hypothetical protein